MSLRNAILQVASSNGFSESFVTKVYKSYWRAVREHITSLPLKKDLTEEEFMQLQPNINIPSIGKLHVTLDRYKKVKKANEIYMEICRKKAEEQENNQ